MEPFIMNHVTVPPSPKCLLQFRLKTLFFAVLLVAWCFGAYSLGRAAGKREVQPEIDRLNAECAALTSRVYLSGAGWIVPPGSKVPPVRTYDLSKPKDREDYRKQFSERSVTTY
jgi:hypothetical protein